MSKILSILFLIGFIVSSMNSYSDHQEDISSEELAGKWKIVKGEGEGWDEELIGSWWEFDKNGTMKLFDKSLEGTMFEETDKGKWKMEGKKITIEVMEEEQEEGKVNETMNFIIVDYDGKQLSLKLSEADLTIYLEKEK